MSASETPDLGKFGPLIVAAIVIVVLVLQQPLTGDVAGISLNWVAVIVIAVGGLAGAFG